MSFGIVAAVGGGLLVGSMMSGGGSSSSAAAPPPDPRLVEAQLKSMGIQDQSIQAIMKQSADMAPLQKEQLQLGLESSRTAYNQSQQDRGWMLGRRGALSGLQDTLVSDAKKFNTEDRTNQLVGEAQADVNAGFSSARDQQTRAMSRMGVNPSSGKALAMGNQTSIAQAAALAGVSNKARSNARTEGYALTDRASNALAGYPAMGMQATGAGAGYGANGISIANTGLAGLNSGNLSAASMAGQMGSNASGMYGAMGSYQTGQNNAQGDGGAGMLVGLAGAAATAY